MAATRAAGWIASQFPRSSRSCSRQDRLSASNARSARAIRDRGRVGELLYRVDDLPGAALLQHAGDQGLVLLGEFVGPRPEVGFLDHRALDPQRCAVLLDGMQPLDDLLRSSGQFGPKVEVPDDADVQSRMLAFIGRDPR